MSSERLYLYDTTLRDGAQTTGVNFSLEDKRTIAGLLDRIGIDYIEGGYPGANPLDTKFFAEKPVLRAKFTRFRDDQAGRAFGVQRSGHRGVARRQRGCNLLRRQGVGLSCPRCA